jgi:hypothetical protein
LYLRFTIGRILPELQSLALVFSSPHIRRARKPMLREAVTGAQAVVKLKKRGYRQ